jgi:hypothetical protein
LSKEIPGGAACWRGRSTATTIDAYLAQVPGGRRERLGVIRRLCLQYLPDHEEVVQRGMPVYLRDGKADFAWANQARYVSLYIMKEGVVTANSERLAGLDMGKAARD